MGFVQLNKCTTGKLSDQYKTWTADYELPTGYKIWTTLVKRVLIGSRGAIHSSKIPTGPTRKSGPPQKVDQFLRNFSGWTEPIHRVLDRNFREFWLNGSHPR